MDNELGNMTVVLQHKNARFRFLKVTERDIIIRFVRS